MTVSDPSDGTPEGRFRQLVTDFGPAIQRVCVGYERDPERRHELRQEILLALWRSLPTFRGDSSIRTWVFRVAHNVAITHVTRAARFRTNSAVSIEEMAGASPDGETDMDRRRVVDRLHAMVEQLGPTERQLMLLYLEDVPQQEIADITGLTLANVSTKIHRVKRALAGRLRRGV